MVVTTPGVYALYGTRLETSLRKYGIRFAVVKLPEGERAKTMLAAGRLYDACMTNKMNRTSPIIAFGEVRQKMLQALLQARTCGAFQ